MRCQKIRQRSFTSTNREGIYFERCINIPPLNSTPLSHVVTKPKGVWSPRDSLNRDIPQWPPTEGEPMRGIHLRMNEWLQYDNFNVLDSNGVFINAILWMGVTTNILRHSNSTIINKYDLQIHPQSSWNPVHSITGQNNTEGKRSPKWWFSALSLIVASLTIHTST